MSVLSESRSAAMADSNVGITNGHRAGVLTAHDLGDHVDQEQNSPEHQTSAKDANMSDNENVVMTGISLNIHQTSTESSASSDSELGQLHSQLTENKKPANPHVEEKSMNSTSLSPKQTRAFINNSGAAALDRDQTISPDSARASPSRGRSIPHDSGALSPNHSRTITQVQLPSRTSHNTSSHISANPSANPSSKPSTKLSSTPSSTPSAKPSSKLSPNPSITPSSKHSRKIESTLQPDSPEFIKFTKDVARLKEVLNETSGAAVSQVLRDEWRALLFYDNYSEDTVSYILRAIIKNWGGSPRFIASVLNDGDTLKEFLGNPTAARKILSSASPAQLSASVPSEVLDQILREKVKGAGPEILSGLLGNPTTVFQKLLSSVSHTQLLAAVPTEILDRTLAERIKSVEAMKLMRWLIDGQRLGYLDTDFIDPATEHVIARGSDSALGDDKPEFLEVEEPRPRPVAQRPEQQKDSLLLEQERNSALAQEPHLQSLQLAASGQIGPCPDCKASFPTLSGYSYHLSRKACSKVAPLGGWKFTCPNCIQGYANAGGYNYHLDKKVCHYNGDVAPTTPSVELPSAPSQTPAYVSRYPQKEAGAIPQGPVPNYILKNQPPAQPYTYNPATRPPLHNQQTQSPGIASRQGPPAPLSRPPMSTPLHFVSPASTSGTPGTPTSIPPGVRRLVSELSPAERARLDAELDTAQRAYDNIVLDIRRTYTTDPAELQQKLTTAKNNINTKLSTIRKAHGVTMRMRQADKDIRKRAGITTPTRRPQAENSMTGSATFTIRPTSSFSPVNGSGSASKSAASSAIPPPSPPMLTQPPQSHPPTSSAMNYSSTLPSSSLASRHGLTAPEPPSGFGVMKMGPQLSSQKRRRSDEEDHGSPRPNGPAIPQPWFAKRTVSSPTTTGLVMTEMKSEDAAVKYGASRGANSGGSVAAPSPTVMNAPPTNTQGGTKDDVIVVTDSETDTDPDPVPTIEKDDD